MGFPPLVTPTSQIVGIQAVQNVLFGRYKVISAQVKDYFYGLYGRPPMPVDPEIQKVALKGYERGETPITVRPADVLKPELEAAREATKDIARDIGDILTYALYPQVGLRFLKWKYGLETPRADTKPRTLDDVKREDDLIIKAKAGKLIEKSAVLAPSPITPAAPIGGLRHFNIHLYGKIYCVGVEPTTTSAPAVSYVAPPSVAQVVAPVPPPAPPVHPEPAEGRKPVETPKPNLLPPPPNHAARMF
jgi:pyruvate carboxylase subunit B